MSIYSLVVHTKPENIESVSAALSKKQDVEVHQINEKGKIVVSLDNPDRGYCSETIMSFHNIPGVLNSSLIYEYFEETDFGEIVEMKKRKQSCQTNTEAS